MHYEFFAFITNALEVIFYSVYCIGLQPVDCKLSFVISVDMFWAMVYVRIDNYIVVTLQDVYFLNNVIYNRSAVYD